MVKLVSREMKDSGIEWIGEIPKDWKLRRYKHFAQSGMGSTILKEDLVEVGIPVYSATQDNTIFGYLENPNIILEKGDFVIPARGNSIGCITIIHKEKATCTQTTIYSKLNGIYNKYLYYCGWGLKDKWFEFDNTAIPQITVNQVQNNIVPYTEILEQQSIANYLDKKVSEIDNIINQTTLSIEEYKKYKQSLITEAVTKGLNPDVEMKDSGIEWNKHIPKHWEVVNGRRLFAQRKEKALDGDKQLTASQKLGIVFQEDFMEAENQKVVLVEKDFSILKHVEPNDFVISMRSFQGGLEHSLLKGCISSAYVMLIPNEKVYAPYFRWLFKSIKYINALQSTSNLVRDGQAMRYSNFVQIPLFVFGINEQQAIAEYLDAKCSEIDNLITKKQKLLTELGSYKKSLIYECVTGKKEVC